MLLLLFKRFNPLDEILTWTKNGRYTHTTVEWTPVSQEIPNHVWHSDNRPNTLFPLSNEIRKKKKQGISEHTILSFLQKK